MPPWKITAPRVQLSVNEQFFVAITSRRTKQVPQVEPVLLDDIIVPKAAAFEETVVAARLVVEQLLVGHSFTTLLLR